MNIAVHTAVMAATMHGNNVASDLPSEPMPVWALVILFTLLLSFVGCMGWLFYQVWKLK